MRPPNLEALDLVALGKLAPIPHSTVLYIAFRRSSMKLLFSDSDTLYCYDLSSLEFA